MGTNIERELGLLNGHLEKLGPLVEKLGDQVVELGRDQSAMKENLTTLFRRTDEQGPIFTRMREADQGLGKRIDGVEGQLAERAKEDGAGRRDVRNIIIATVAAALSALATFLLTHYLGKGSP